MSGLSNLIDRRTSADVVFDALYDEIVSLRMLPGAKISEAEIAATYGVSRQPVRDAFRRLGNMGFLLIRPQKATEIQKFSVAAITSARFLRTAVEIEVVKRAVERWTDGQAAAYLENLAEQDNAVHNHDADAFHELDFDFHRQLCGTAGAAFAFDDIMESKAQVDRLCLLSMMDNDAMATLVSDHRAIFNCLKARDSVAIEAAVRLHMTRLDGTIKRVRESHPDYFI
ncbi:transcriptional regulator, GntR family [Cognatiyoonia koreensis]|uniref:Transcriptional regulator, GntR family n=1 Tax=Cognatiyoonia koreensis TaxID=364200 RepID=A0A1I0RTU8_9RHOB|nr:GntR family transcriptional regulator [Cognatiyoonia koreensis]SEW44850.1 transcriptional regulator, GntR family [Cognatiyoonia koreensis]